MSCRICKMRHGPFKTEKNYLILKKQIEFLVENKKLKKLGEVDPSSPFLKVRYEGHLEIDERLLKDLIVATEILFDRVETLWV